MSKLSVDFNEILGNENDGQLYLVIFTDSDGKDPNFEIWRADSPEEVENLMKRNFIQDADVDNEEEMADSIDAKVWEDTTFAINLIGEILV